MTEETKRVMDEETVNRVTALVDKIHETAVAAGTSLRKDFRPDKVFPKTDPLAKLGSALEATKNTLDALAKDATDAAKREADLRAELDEAVDAVKTLVGENKHLLKGDKPCKDCKALGKSKDEKSGKDEDCKPCGATGWIAKK